jgi:uncharacterized protein YndB with AHSA1/START domain
MITEATSDFVVTGVFDAPREKVWRCFTEPERMKEWFGPKGSTVVESNMDFRVGGTYHGALRAGDGPVMWAKFVYRDIVPPQQLVWVHSFSDAAGGLTRHPLSSTWPLQLVTTVTFEDLGAAKTKVTLRWSPLDATSEEQKTFEAAHDSCRTGWSGSFEQLKAYLHRG